MSKKKRRVKKRERQSRARAIPWLGSDGLHALMPGNAPSPETLDEMTGSYQQKIRESPLWEEMVRECGEKEAERLLREFRVEIR